MARKSKSIETEETQFLPGDGTLRRHIKAVCSAHGADGKPLNKHALRIGEKWGLVDALDLVKGKADRLVQLSSDNGLKLDLNKAEYAALANQIAGAVDGAAIVLDSPGYQRIHWKGAKYEALVWRGCLHWFDEEPDVVVIVDEAEHAQLVEAQGTLKKWNHEIGKHFAKNPYMMVTFGAALSSLLIRPLALEPLMLILVGRSSIGKTAVQKTVQSIVRPGPVPSASGTVIGLHQQMSFDSDHPVILQELRQVDDLGGLISLAFDHGNSARRVIGNASQKAVVGRPLNCVLIGSNERTLAEMVRNRNVPIDTGIDARVLEIFVDGPHGIFHELPDDTEPSEFAEYLSTSSESLHGAVWDEWVRVVAQNIQPLREKADVQLPQIRRWLEKKANAEDRVFKRMLNGYAGWMFAALRARAYGVISATGDEIKNAFATVIQEHQKRREAGMNPTEQSIIDQIRASIDESPGRFVPLAQAQADLKKNGLWGYEHQVDGKKLYLFFKSSIGNVAPSSGIQDILAVLKATGMLKHNKDELMYSVRMPNSVSTKRFYAIRAEIRYDG